jgi:hypothetical protein
MTEKESRIKAIAIMKKSGSILGFSGWWFSQLSKAGSEPFRLIFIPAPNCSSSANSLRVGSVPCTPEWDKLGLSA